MRTLSRGDSNIQYPFFEEAVPGFFFPSCWLLCCTLEHMVHSVRRCQHVSQQCDWLRSQQHSDCPSQPIQFREIFSNLPLRQPVSGQSRRHSQQLLLSGKVKPATVHQWPHRPIYRITQEESKQKARDVASIAKCQRRMDLPKLFNDMCSLLPV